MKYIMIVDDTLFYQKLLTSVAEKFGCNVVCSDGSDDVIAIIDQYKPYLLIIDMHLTSGIEGLNIIRNIRKNIDYNKIKIIDISAHATKLKEVELEQLSCVSLAKPLEINKLYELISNA